MKKFSFHWESPKLTIVLRGVLTFEDIVALCDARISDERFDSIRYILHDLREVEGIEASQAEIRSALIYASQSKYFGRRSWMLVGFVSNNPSIREKVTVFIEGAKAYDPNWDRRLFDSIEESDDWAARVLAIR